MDLKNPEYLLELDKRRSITRAAEQLYITQSSLSQYLLKLESEMGLPLFTRSKNELIPTEAGKLCIQAAKDIVRIQDRLQEGLATLQNRGCITMGVSSLWGLRLAARLMEEFKQLCPHTTLKIYEGRYAQLKERILSEKVDIAVTAIPHWQELAMANTTLLRREELVLALSQDHIFCADHPEQTLSCTDLPRLLGRIKFIASDEGSTIREVENELFQSLLFHPDTVCELNDNPATLELVRNGVGAAIVPAEYIVNCPDIRGYHLNPMIGRDDILVERKHLEHTPEVDTLLRLIRENPLFA